MSEARAPYRFAVYWAPPRHTALAQIGEAWLGRSAEDDRCVRGPSLAGFDAAELARATAEPRRYGLHATLKPPFRLADGRSTAELEAALAEFAREQPGVAAAPLRLKRIGRFLALVPGARSAVLDALAATCVERFDRFRAPADPAELSRRRAAGLTASQETNLVRWGYPYVMEDFRFHVSLTGTVEPALAERLEPALAEHFAEALSVPLEIGELALSIEPAPGAPFRALRRFELAGAAKRRGI